MLAENNQYIKDAVTTIRQLTQEEKIRQQCEAREDYYRRTAGREKLLKKTTLERDQFIAENKDLKEQISQKDDEIAENKTEIAKKDADIARKDADIAKKDAEIERLRSLLSNHNSSGVNIN